jgi:hypothetical protein
MRKEANGKQNYWLERPGCYSWLSEAKSWRSEKKVKPLCLVPGNPENTTVDEELQNLELAVENAA